MEVVRIGGPFRSLYLDRIDQVLSCKKGAALYKGETLGGEYVCPCFCQFHSININHLFFYSIIQRFLLGMLPFATAKVFKIIWHIFLCSVFVCNYLRLLNMELQLLLLVVKPLLQSGIKIIVPTSRIVNCDVIWWPKES